MTCEQGKLFALLQFFSEVCERNNLHYYLVGGTLLGAVRHQGFIPWDDDIDVAMPLDDYKKFLQLAPKLPDGMIIQTEQTDLNYPFFFSKLCNTKVSFKTKNRNGPAGIYIDIFPLVPSCAPTKRSCIYFNAVSIIGYVLQVKSDWTSFIPYKKRYAKLGYRLLSMLSQNRLRRLRHWFIKMLSSTNTEYCFSPGGVHKGNTEFYLKDWFEKSIPIIFEGVQFSAPLGWNAYLAQLYGDYMTLPDESQRKTLHKG